MRLLWSDSAVIAIFLLQWSSLDAFLTTNDRAIDIRCRPARAFSSATTARASVTASSSVLPDDVGTSSSASLATQARIPIGSLVRKEGGLFSFKTKYGALNPYAIFYGLFAILLGIPWFIALTFCQLMYKITNNRWDPQRFMPVALSQLWGTLLTFFTYCYPKIENRQILVDFLKEYVMFLDIKSHQVFSQSRVFPFSHDLCIYVFFYTYLLVQKTTGHVCCESRFLDGYSLPRSGHWMEELQNH